jgi:putative oxidoreductase
MNTTQKTIYWGARLIAAIILLQTLFFKFTGAPESVYIFTKAGIEPWGRYASGIAELIAAVLLIVPATVWLGALLSLGVISGALMTHLTILGIEVMNDGGTLFWLAVIVFICSAYAAYADRFRIPLINRLFQPANVY